MFKLAYKDKKKIVKLQSNTFQELRKTIEQSFAQIPKDYALSYHDEDKDQICLNCHEDMHNMMLSQKKVYKVYIKDSISQTVVLDLEKSDLIQPSFHQSSFDLPQSAIKEELKDFSKKVNEPQPELQLQLQSETEARVQLSSEEQKEEVIREREEEEKAVDVKIEPEIKEAESQQILVSSVNSEPKEVPQEKIDISEVLMIHPGKFEIARTLATQMEVSPKAKVISAVDPTEEIPPVKEEQPQQDEKKGNNTRAKIFDFNNAKLDPQPQPKSQPKSEQKPESRSKLPQGEYKPEVKPEEIVASEILVQHDVICSSCEDEFGIVGVLYQCIFCEGFNICSSCEQKFDHTHPLVKVKKAGQQIKKEELIEKFGSHDAKGFMPRENYVPSINKEETAKIVEAAREAYKQGVARSERLMEDIFYKLSVSHKNPYEKQKPAQPKVQTIWAKVDYLRSIANISFEKANSFANSHPRENKEQLVECYFQEQQYRRR